MLPLTRSRNRARFFGIPFSPLSLFAQGEQGTWYDPSDFSTLFQDSAGTTPVTGVEQVVGLMLDKRVPVAQTGYYSGVFDGSGDYLSVPSNAAFAFGTGDFTVETWVYPTVLGSNNQIIAISSGTGLGFVFTNTGQVYVTRAGVAVDNTFSGSGIVANQWFHVAISRSGTTIRCFVNGNQLGASQTNTVNFLQGALNVGIDTNGVNSPFAGYISNLRVVKGTAVYTSAFTPPTTPLTAISGTSLLTCQNSTFIDNSPNAFTITAVGDAKTGANNPFGNHATSTGAARPTLRALYNIFTGTATLATQTKTTLAAAYTLSFSGAGSITLSGTATGTFNAGTHSVTCTAGSLTATVSGTVTNADMRLTSDLLKGPAYQAVVTATNYDTAGFLPYLSWGGTQAMSTGSIDFTATDKMTVWAGVTKLAAGLGFIAELSASVSSNNGTFYVVSDNGTNDYGISLKGTAQATYQPATYAAPITNTLSASFDIGAASISTENIPRVNGIVEQDNPGGANAGTGNFGNYPLYIGARNLASSFFNGRLYQLCTRGAQSTAAEISAMEAYTNQRTGAY